jgi:bifunctional non-homologous end joining protein LigD
MAADHPDRFVAHVKISDRRNRILIDWLRNGLGATAIANFSPRPRPGATVAAPLTWREVTEKLDPSTFTIKSVPARLAKQKAEPWAEFAECDQNLPVLQSVASSSKASKRGDPSPPARSGSSIVRAAPPRKR